MYSVTEKKFINELINASLVRVGNEKFWVKGMFQSRILSLQCSLIFKSFFSSMDELQISGRSSVASSRPKPKPKTLVSCYTSHFRRYGLLLWVCSENIVSFNFTKNSKFEVNCRYDSRFLRIIFDSDGSNDLSSYLEIAISIDLCSAVWNSLQLTILRFLSFQVQDIHYEVASVHEDGDTNKWISPSLFRMSIMGSLRIA